MISWTVGSVTLEFGNGEAASIAIRSQLRGKQGVIPIQADPSGEIPVLMVRKARLRDSERRTPLQIRNVRVRPNQPEVAGERTVML